MDIRSLIMKTSSDDSYEMEDSRYKDQRKLGIFHNQQMRADLSGNHDDGDRLHADSRLDCADERSEQIKSFENRLIKIEQIIEDNFALKKPDSNRRKLTPAPVSDFPTIIGQSTRRYDSPGRMSLFHGFPIFTSECQAWASSCLRKSGISSEPSCISFFPTTSKEQFHHSIGRPPGKGQDIPELCAVRRLLASYSSYTINVDFPVIDYFLFEQTLSKAYAPEKATTVEGLRAKACIQAFLRFVSVFLPVEELGDLSLDGADLPAVLGDFRSYIWRDVSIESLQICIMMMVSAFFTGNLHDASICNSLAVQIVSHLGLHRTSLSEATSWSRNLRDRDRNANFARNLLWMTYILDKELCLQTGRPPALNDAYFCLTLPLGHLEYCQGGEQAFTSSHVSAPDSSMLYDTRLALIKSKIYDELYSAQAKCKSDAQLLEDVKSLDADLERWRTSLPLSFRTQIGLFKQKQLHRDIEMRTIMVNLVYHHCLSLIREASCRCPSSTSDQEMRVENLLVEDSGCNLDFVLEASRSSLRYFIVARSMLSREYFWIFIFFPLCALSKLFLTFLLKPRSSLITEDKRLMETAIHVMENLAREHEPHCQLKSCLQSLKQHLKGMGKISDQVIPRQS